MRAALVLFVDPFAALKTKAYTGLMLKPPERVKFTLGSTVSLSNINRPGKSRHKETCVESRCHSRLEFKTSAANDFNAGTQLVPAGFPGIIIANFSHRYAKLLVKKVSHSIGIGKNVLGLNIE
jgi:hypothetical protein